MSGEELTDLDGYHMDRESAAELLASTGVGVLSLSAEGESYALPMSFGYDGGERLYFVFLEAGDESLKARFADETTRACVTVFEADDDAERGGDDWASVVAKGPVRRVETDEWDELREALADNAWHPSLFTAASPTGGVTGYALRIDELTGRHGGGYEFE
ncbi:pyridoxamine 5'-phosphate oxidase family protein [Salinirubrum litoreum]|uniref:Pyridoxamine 5'-phosphate oxidase family protein n=1 Tax=Salinirubrum litoreum TaxID=1126234 RepID=A0ABD5R7T3_9EURY|nr:pyridoxamine 5'-phosphate oxidase family protein [Salinirubrum litoreum]